MGQFPAMHPTRPDQVLRELGTADPGVWQLRSRLLRHSESQYGLIFVRLGLGNGLITEIIYHRLAASHNNKTTATTEHPTSELSSQKQQPLPYITDDIWCRVRRLPCLMIYRTMGRSLCSLSSATQGPHGFVRAFTNFMLLRCCRT